MNRVLLELQGLDTQILSLARARKALDDGTRARSERDATAQLLETARAEAKSVAQTRRAKEGESEAIDAKMTRQKARLESSSSAGDVAALERDLVGLSHARGELDEAILELMDESEGVDKKIKALETELRAREGEAEHIDKEFARRTAELDGQIAQKRAARPAIAGKLTPAESEKYEAAFKKFNGLGVSEAISGACSACGTSLSRDFLRDAVREAFPQCESCGRLIFVAG